MTIPRYQFTFDSSTCSGCKACQVACKDRNGLETGRLWRRVYEVGGGGWRQQGAAWVADTFAYNLSVSCNHCQQPICAEVCPTQAITQRPDGIVLLDEGRCIGCKYCSWACPYGAPQYDPARGCMSKCNFCVENLAQGLPPACVAACGLRSLEYSLDGGSSNGRVAVVPPLPDPGWTEPALQIIPHRDAVRAQSAPLRVANQEEVRPAGHGSELPLALFTVLAQLAAGLALAAGAIYLGGARWIGPLTAQGLALPALLAAGAALGLGMLLSLGHLGRPWRAYRALYGLRSSWLSREILLAGLFAAGLAAFTGLLALQPGSPALPAAYAWSGLSGLGLVYAMLRVYRQRTLPAWDTWRTAAAFFLTAALLGLLGAGALLAPAAARLAAMPGESLRGSLEAWVRGGALAAVLLLAVDWVLQGWFERQSGGAERARRRRAPTGFPGATPGLGQVCSLGALICLLPLLLSQASTWLPILFIPAFQLALVGQFLGRMQFYRVLEQRRL